MLKVTWPRKSLAHHEPTFRNFVALDYLPSFVLADSVVVLFGGNITYDIYFFIYFHILFNYI